MSTHVQRSGASLFLVGIHTILSSTTYEPSPPIQPISANPRVTHNPCHIVAATTPYQPQYQVATSGSTLTFSSMKMKITIRPSLN